MIAIVSDIHGNYEALLAVRDDINQLADIEQVVCLGDIVGSGPNPGECVDLSMQWNVVILGDQDQGVLFGSQGYDTGADRAIFLSRAQLENDDGPNADARWEFLGERPRMHKEGDFLFVHGSARNPLNEYVFPEDIHNPRKMDRIFKMVDKYCFQGHTHVPGIFTEDLHFHSPAEVDYEYRLDGHKTLINVGSVGQSRDADPRACYVVVDGDLVNYRRIAYGAA